MVEDLRGRVHLAQDGEHLVVDEGLVLGEVHVEVVLEAAADGLARHLVEVHAHHDLLQRAADHALRLISLPRPGIPKLLLTRHSRASFLRDRATLQQLL